MRKKKKKKLMKNKNEIPSLRFTAAKTFFGATRVNLEYLGLYFEIRPRRQQTDDIISVYFYKQSPQYTINI